MSNIALRFANSAKDTRTRWTGVVLDWQQKYGFNGKPLECPREVTLHCYASNEDEASYLLNRIAEHQGYALGGVQKIARSSDSCMPISKKAKAKQKVTSLARRQKNIEDMSLEQMEEYLAKLQAELSRR